MTIYMDQSGNYYKADAPRNSGDAIKPFPSDNLVALLTEEPMHPSVVESNMTVADNLTTTLDSMGLSITDPQAAPIIDAALGLPTSVSPTIAGAASTEVSQDGTQF